METVSKRRLFLRILSFSFIFHFIFTCSYVQSPYFLYFLNIYIPTSMVLVNLTVKERQKKNISNK